MGIWRNEKSVVLTSITPESLSFSFISQKLWIYPSLRQVKLKLIILHTWMWPQFQFCSVEPGDVWSAPERLPREQLPLQRANSPLGCIGAISPVLALHKIGCWHVCQLGTSQDFSVLGESWTPVLQKAAPQRHLNVMYYKNKWAIVRRILKFTFISERTYFYARMFYLILNSICSCEVKNI